MRGGMSHAAEDGPDSRYRTVTGERPPILGELPFVDGEGGDFYALSLQVGAINRSGHSTRTGRAYDSRCAHPVNDCYGILEPK